MNKKEDKDMNNLDCECELCKSVEYWMEKNYIPEDRSMILDNIDLIGQLFILTHPKIRAEYKSLDYLHAEVMGSILAFRFSPTPDISEVL